MVLRASGGTAGSIPVHFREPPRAGAAVTPPLFRLENVSQRWGSVHGMKGEPEVRGSTLHGLVR
jgi:hypothetical protein